MPLCLLICLFFVVPCRMRSFGSRKRRIGVSSTARFTLLDSTWWELSSTPSFLIGNPICLVISVSFTFHILWVTTTFCFLFLFFNWAFWSLVSFESPEKSYDFIIRTLPWSPDLEVLCLKFLLLGMIWGFGTISGLYFILFFYSFFN